jgi:hypothetical protein
MKNETHNGRKTMKKIHFVIAVAGAMVLSALAIPAGAATSDQINQAITNGVIWLVSQQNSNGSWGSSYPVAYTGFAVAKLEDRAFELGYTSPFDDAYPYKTNVINGLNYLFNQVSTNARTGGFCFVPGSGVETYCTGIGMIAIAASRAPTNIVNITNSLVNGMTYKAVLQSIVNYFAAGQNPDGGWRYNPSYSSSDNSNTGYAVTGLRFAETPLYGFECVIPATLKAALSTNWIKAIQDNSGDSNDGGGGYTSGSSGVNLLETGNLLFEMSFVGDNTSIQRVQRAMAYIQTNWNDNNENPGWRPHQYQAMDCLMEGFGSLSIASITVNGTNVDWFGQFSDAIVASQQSNGSWPPDGSGDTTLCTDWALLVLERVSGGEPLQIIPATGFDVTGCVGGPFSITNGTFSLTDVGITPLNWSLANNSTWLDASLGGGTLAVGGTTNVTVGLTPNAYFLPSGVYTATVWFTNLNDGVGQSRQFTLTVGLPVITAEPTNQTIKLGGTATFSAAVLGPGPFTYQWQKNGTCLTNTSNISGSTTTNLILTNVSTNDDGSYAIIITDACGSVTSSVAMLFPASGPIPVPVVTGPLWWIDTGISLTAGATVMITASGYLQMEGYRPFNTGPDGWPYTTDSLANIFSGANLDALIAYVGSDPFQGHWGDPSFFPTNSGYWNIGSSNQFTSTNTNSGELWLGVNDTAVFNNSPKFGSVMVQITGRDLIYTWPPVMSIQTVTPGLNFVQGAISGQSVRQNIRTANSTTANYSWVSKATPIKPVTYFLNISQWNAPDLTFHVFITPFTSDTASAPDYNQANVMIFQIGPQTNVGTVANIFWKTNLPSALANHTNTIPQITNLPSLLGTWQLQFTSDTAGVIIAPDSTSYPFVVDSGLAAGLANPVYINFGISPSSDANSVLGESVVVSQIGIAGVDSLSTTAAVTNDNFLDDLQLNTNIWAVNAQYPPSIWFVPTNSAYSVDWTIPDTGFSLIQSSSLLGLSTETNAGLPIVALTPGARVLVPNNGSTEFFALIKRTFTKLQILLPGEAAAPNTSTGKTGTPIAQANSTPFNVTINAVDDSWNIVNAGDQIALADPDPNFCVFSTPTQPNLSGGTATMQVIFLGDGSSQLTVTDLTDNTKTPNTSSTVTY